MRIQECSNEQEWQEVLEGFSYPPFTQMWAWGMVQQALGKTVRRFLFREGDRAILMQCVQERRGSLVYWFAPQGPVYTEVVSSQDLETFLARVEERLASWNACFVRVEPRRRAQRASRTLIEALPMQSGRRIRSMNPSTSFLTSLRGTADEVFETFHKKTRYNVRLAERHAVIIRGSSIEDLPIFFALHKQTEERDGFTGHSEAYLRTVFETLSATGHARLRIAECLGKPLAANIEILCGDTVMYAYGASSSEDREKMAPYALQWSAIFAALQEGYAWYDFGGGNSVSGTGVDDRPTWEGITRFKERWGTIRHADAGTFDRVMRPLVYKLLVRR